MADRSQPASQPITMESSNSTLRFLKDELLEEYEPMTSLYWKKHKKPNIDIRESPFAQDRQLEDQRFSMVHNRVSQFNQLNNYLRPPHRKCQGVISVCE